VSRVSRIITRMNDEQRWAIWEAKDARYDGQFFVAVRTTGVYCRPSCPARPLRKNVQFFDAADAAEAAGFRACKRCHPRAERLPSEQLTARITTFIAEHGHARLDALSTETGYSPFHLQRVFKQAVGVSPLQFAKAQRAQQLKSKLKQPVSVTTAVLDAGYGSHSQIYADGGALGMTPGDYKAGGAGAQIDYAFADTALGRMLVAVTARGLCAIYFGDDDAQLLRELRAEYPRAALSDRERVDAHQYIDQLTHVLAGRARHATLHKLPIDVQSTAFQAQVWQALRAIPEGETRSYQQVAQAIGRPTAMRAVANACGANRVAVVIPCHRVVREGGASGGYRWGVERKRKLLEAEREKTTDDGRPTTAGA
jgi:AraC family transcriptional regulator, regulatory protein of adaptative response / methylated-DNA-[protein]-cysteine methyltransferase